MSKLQRILATTAVNSTPTASHPKVLDLDNSRFLVAYATQLGGLAGNNDGFHVRGQIYNADGIALENEIAFPVAAQRGESGVLTREFDIDVMSNGQIVIATLADPFKNDSTPVIYTVFDLDDNGSARLALTQGQASSNLFDLHNRAIVSVAGGDRIVVHSIEAKGPVRIVNQRVFGGEGQSNSFNFIGNFAQAKITSCTLENGNVVLALDRDGETGTGTTIYHRVTSPVGTFVSDGEAFGEQRGTVFEPKVAALKGGGYVVVATENDGDKDIVFQVFDDNSNIVVTGGEIGIEDAAGRSNNNESAVVALPDGGFLIFYDKDAGAPQIRCQRFDERGNRTGRDTAIVNENGGQLDASLIDQKRVALAYSIAGGAIKLVVLTIDQNVIRGTDGEDQIVGSDEADLILTGLGNDIIDAGDGNDEVNASPGDDLVRGQAGNDLIRGGEGRDILAGNEGADGLFGGAGDDNLAGGQGDDIILGEDGDDNVIGGQGGDVIHGGDGDDTLNGGSGNDSIAGGLGRDIVDGGLGQDTLKGGRGSDRFIFRDNYGDAVIVDFNADGESDLIDLSGVSNISGFDDLISNHVQQNENHVVIFDGNGTRITLEGIRVADLKPRHFLF